MRTYATASGRPSGAAQTKQGRTMRVFAGLHPFFDLDDLVCKETMSFTMYSYRGLLRGGVHKAKYLP
jgi:hypothetical protein